MGTPSFIFKRCLNFYEFRKIHHKPLSGLDSVLVIMNRVGLSPHFRGLKWDGRGLDNRKDFQQPSPFIQGRWGIGNGGWGRAGPGLRPALQVKALSFFLLWWWLLTVPMAYGRFWGQRGNPSHSCNQLHSHSKGRIFNPLGPSGNSPLSNFCTLCLAGEGGAWDPGKWGRGVSLLPPSPPSPGGH